MSATRYAIVRNASAERLERYLPANYRLVHADGEGVLVIAGQDNAGWTLDDYVIPRLASGLIWCTELVTKESA